MKLVILDGPLRGQEFPLGDDVVKIGRKRDATVTLPGDTLVSRYHCQLFQRDGDWWLEDLGSGNGTHVGDDVCEAPMKVDVEQVIRVGRTRLLVAPDELDAEEAISGITRVAAPAGEARTITVDEAALAGDGVRVVGDDNNTTGVDIASTLDPATTINLPLAEDAGTMRRLRKRLEVFQRVATAMSGRLERRELFEAVVESLMEVVEAQRGFVLEVDEERSKLRCAVVRQVAGAPASELTVSRTLLKRALDDRVGVLVNDAFGDSGLAGAQSIMLSSVRSALSVPMVDGDTVAAIIHLDAMEARAFTEEDLELASAVANQAALALSNSRLYGELREAHEELKAAHEQMVQTEKLTSIGTLAASIAHDVGNVLTPISGIAKLVMRDESIDPKLRDAFDRQIQRLKALAQQLLSFSRPKPPELGAIDLHAQLDESLNLVTTEARHAQVTIEREFAPDLPQVQADGSRLDQVFINLALNAIHAMGGKEGNLTVSTRQDGREVVVDVADTGSGIPEDKLLKIFQPFFTTKGKQGTGMGLFSCKRIIEEEHRGRLAVKSELGKGTTFTIRLAVAG